MECFWQKQQRAAAQAAGYETPACSEQRQGGGRQSEAFLQAGEVLRCPVCGAQISAEDRVLWQDGRIRACPECLARQGFAWRAVW